VPVASARERNVAHAAPRVPIAGSGPQPRMKNGSITTFNPAEMTTSHMAVFVSPAPCREARKAKKRKVSGRAKKITSMYARDSVNTAPSAPISVSSSRRRTNPSVARVSETASVSRIVWATTRSACRSSSAPTYCETSAIVAAVTPIAVETKSHVSGNISETAATASELTRPTQNISARL